MSLKLYFILFCNYLNSFPKKILLAQFIVTFFLFLPILCYNLPWSAYFRPHEHNYAAYLSRNDDERRTALAETYLGQKVKQNDFPYQYKSAAVADSEHPSVAIVFQAVDRNKHEIDAYEPHYLSQTLIGMFKALDLEQRDNGQRFSQINMSICNVDLKPNTFGEALRLDKFVPMFARTTDELEKAKKSSLKCKECLAKSNLAFCLRNAVRSHPDAEYIVVLEDDMVAQIDSMSALHNIITVRLRKRFRNLIPLKLGYIQLHSPLKHYSYNWADNSAWVEVFVMSVLGTFVLITFYYRFHFRPFNMVQNIILTAMIFFYCITVVLLVGRQHWLGARHAVTRQYTLSDPILPGFTSALLPRGIATELSDQLEAAVDDPQSKFSVIDKFMEQNKRRTFAVYPSLFRHIGLYSHYHKKVVNPYELDN